jgi:hypothetical protein
LVLENNLAFFKTSLFLNAVIATKDKEILALKDEITANKSAFDKDKSEYKNELMGVLLERDVATVLPKYD